MTDWWNSLSAVLQIFYGIAIFSSFVLVVQTIMLVAGLGMHDFTTGDLDQGGQGDHASGLSFLSLRTIIAFLTGFGWTGVLVTNAGGSIYLAAPLALLVGFALAATILWLMRSMRRLAHDGSLDYANAIGQVATVYVTIPPRAAAGGQVEVMVQGRLSIITAISRGEVAIAPGTKVRVSELADRTTLIVTAV